MRDSAHDDTPYMWYASYASNLSRKRFLCYIRGGVPEKSRSWQPGCKDKTVPRLTKKISIPHQLYFAKSSSGWDNGGVGFIGLSRTEEDGALGRMYLITREQFIDVVSQENDNIPIALDFGTVVDKGSAFLCESWYGNIIFLGENEGFPIYTFTALRDIGFEPFTAPSEGYLQTIALGLREAYGLGSDEICEYLMKKAGVKGNYEKETLAGIVKAVSIL